MKPQHTIAKPVSLQGVGLFTGQEATVRFCPAPANHGIVFVRTDLSNAEVPATYKHLVPRSRRSAIKSGQAVVETIEHALSAMAGLRIDNLRIEIDGPEVPIMDGSAKPFFDALADAGLVEQDAPRRYMKITEPILVQQDDATITALPCAEEETQFVYELDYSKVSTVIGHQVRTFDFTHGDYAHEIAPSRTFALKEEAEAARAAGMFTHVSEDDTLVIDEEGPMGSNRFRFPDEPVRHKTLDLIGDLYLLGCPVQGRIIAHKSGHPLNHQLVGKLIEQQQFQHRRHITQHETAIDIKRLMKMLPHRFPMLLVDRVVEIDGDRRAVGVKNVSINEPFFQGHYPGTPIMPGVLVVEAMAQLSGVLIGQNLEHTGKLAVLLSLDRVKLRRPITPGDQLTIEAEAVKVRSRIAQMSCRAYVAEELAAEAEVKFMLVDDDQE